MKYAKIKFIYVIGLFLLTFIIITPTFKPNFLHTTNYNQELNKVIPESEQKHIKSEFSTLKQNRVSDRVIDTELIINYEEVFKDEIVEIQANLIISDNGKLTIDNCFVNFLCNISGEFFLIVEAGGTLEIINNSFIQSRSNSIRSSIKVNELGKFKSHNSSFYHLGYNSYLYDDVFHPSSPALYINSNEFLIDSCEFKECTNAVYISENSINGIIKDSMFHSNMEYAIYINNSQNIYLTSLEIISGSHYSIFAGYGANNITIISSNFRSNYYGCHLSGCSDVFVHDNLFYGNYYGFYINDLQNSTISNNVISNSYYYGFYITRTYSSIIEFNSLSSISVYGMIMKYSSDNVIRRNEIWEISTGILFENDNGKTNCNSNNSITMNSIWNVDNGIIIDKFSENNTIWFNSFYDIDVIFAFDSSVYNKWDNGSIGNFWESEYTGTDNNGDFIGDSTYYSSFILDHYPLMVNHNLYVEYLTNPPEEPEEASSSLMVFELIIALITMKFYMRKKRMVNE